MKMALIIAIAASLAPAVRGGDGGFADLVAKVQGAVVSIQTVQETPVRGRNPFEEFFGGPHQRQAPEGWGTGFVITPDGYILTNRHVVADSKEITVQTLGGQSYNGKVIGTDDSLDVALVKIDANNLVYLEMGDSDSKRVGDVVLAMGYPLRLGFTVTSGIISGIGRDLNVFDIDVARYIQTDADITFGNSGGPLIDSSGKVIGINTLIVSQGETYGFSIPSNLFRNAAEQLKEHGRVKRGALGVGLADLDEDARAFYAVTHGARITTVNDGLPAKAAGIQTDDVILDIDGVTIKNSNDVIDVISNKLPGDKVTLTLVHDGKTSKKTVALGDRDKLIGKDAGETEEMESEDATKDFGLGFSALTLDDRTRRELGLGREVQGVVIDDVDEAVTRHKGLERGMIVTEINGQDITNISDFEKAMKKVPSGKPVRLRVTAMTRTFQGNQAIDRTIFITKK